MKHLNDDDRVSDEIDDDEKPDDLQELVMELEIVDEVDEGVVMDDQMIVEEVQTDEEALIDDLQVDDHRHEVVLDQPDDQPGVIHEIDEVEDVL